MAVDLYIDPASGILRNKLGITNAKALEFAEYAHARKAAPETAEFADVVGVLDEMLIALVRLLSSPFAQSALRDIVIELAIADVIHFIGRIAFSMTWSAHSGLGVPPMVKLPNSSQTCGMRFRTRRFMATIPHQNFLIRTTGMCLPPP